MNEGEIKTEIITIYKIGLGICVVTLWEKIGA